MPYVPPHLRSSQSTHSSSSATTGNNTTTETLETDQQQQQKLNSQWNQNNSSSSSSVSFNAARRSSSSNLPSSRTTLSVPEPVFQQWKPSERVFRLKPEQIEEVRLRLNVDVTVSPDSPPAPAPIESFTDMCLDTSIMKDITFHEYTRPTSIQAQAMPVALNGRDLLGCAETGSGKTAAFAIPMIQHCLAQPPIRRGDGPLALVLAPTRELAQQIEKEVKAFSKSLESFRTAIVVGGTNMAEQRSELRAGVNIVVATPGRFIDHLQQGNTSLSRISFVVLDEADRMLDMGFEPQIREVMHNLPKKHQTLLFSATMPLEIEALAQEYLTNPVQVKVGKVSSPTANVSQNLEKVAENEKIDRLLALLVEEAAQSDRSGHPLPLTIVFVERKTRCDEVEEALVAQGLHAVALHGGRSQSEREAALRDFRNGSTNILVATDVASRGLDVTGVAHVINLDLPKTMEDYVHRIGRTGRAGSTGQATSFYTDRDMFLVAHIRKAINDAESGNSIAFATGKIMSIISQNVVRTNKKIKVTGEETDEPLVQEGSEETEVANDSSLDGSKSRKRKKEASEKEKKSNIKQGKEMKRLENFLFGSLYSPVVFGKEEEEETNDALMITDRSGVRDLEGIEDDVEFREESGDEIEIKDRKPAWVDDEEDKTNIDIAKLNRLRKLRKDEKETSILGSDYVERLRAHHVKLNPGTEWAHAGPRSGDGSDSEKEAGEDVKDTDDILRTNEDIVVKGGVKLLPGHLEFSKLADANVEDPSNGPINSVQFHRNAQLLLTAGLDRRLRFFQIDGKRNTMIQSIFLEDCPIRKAAFLPDGSQVIAAGRRKFFYSFDLVKAKVDKIGPLTGRDEKSLEVFGVSPDSSTIAFVGNEGYILLVSTRTKELIGTMKMNGTARSLAFADDGRQLLSSGGDGHVYHWDLRTRTCFHKAVDEGCINGSSLSTSPNGSLFAAGSGSGIVNIYNRAEFLGGKRKPIKTVENITTKVDFAKFNHDSQILAICSSMQKNSLKLVHIPSFSVFSNWPPANQILHFPRCLDFSPGGGFMAVGNAVGKVLLYKLHHYPHA